MHRLLIRINHKGKKSLAERRPDAVHGGTVDDVDFLGVMINIGYRLYRIAWHYQSLSRVGEPVRIRIRGLGESRRVWPGRRRGGQVPLSDLWGGGGVSSVVLFGSLILWWRTEARSCSGSSQSR